MKRVLITGAGGFVGSHVLRHFLVNTNWELVLLDSFLHKGKVSRINQQMKHGAFDYSRRVSVVTHDLTAPIDPQLAESIGPVDYVLNVASRSHVDSSITSPRPFILNNVQLMLTMLEYARRTPSIRKFIQISTDEVYGPAPDSYQHKEGEAHRPSNPYSASKAAQEDICYAYWRTYNVPIIVTNTMNIIGEMQDPEKFVPKVIQHIRAGKRVPIHASAAGVVGSRFYLHARNQADALLFLLKEVTPARFGQAEMMRYNVVGEQEIDNLELAKMIACFLDTPLKYELIDFHTSRPGHDLRYALDGTKMAALGWHAPLSLEDSLKKTVEWTLAHPEWL